MTIIITPEDLRTVHACLRQRSIFNAEWPHGCVVNEATIRRAIELHLDVEWAVKHLASPNIQYKYYKASKQATDTFHEERARLKAQVTDILAHQREARCA